MDEADDTEYSSRSVNIINMLIGEVFPYSEFYEGGSRSEFTPITALTDEIYDIDNALCISVMPYGLAAHLLADENPTLANFFQQRYDELRNRNKNRPAAFEATEDVCGVGTEYNEFSRWG